MALYFSIKDLPVSGPVGSWLSELKNVHESECTIMLQSKPVRRSESESVQEGIADTKERIKLIQDRAHLLSGLFANMCRLVIVKQNEKEGETGFGAKMQCKILSLHNSI